MLNLFKVVRDEIKYEATTKCSFLSAYSRRLLQNQAKPVNLIRMKFERKNVMSKGVDFAKAQANASSL